MLMELEPGATPVSQALVDLNIPHRVLRHLNPLRSLEQAAEERGQRHEQVVRSIVFRAASGEFVMVLVAGPAQIAWPAVRQHIGQSRLTTATEEELVRETGYTRGAVAPFALPNPMRILIDRGLTEEEEVSMGSGVQGTTVILKTADLLRGLPGAEIGNFVQGGRTV
jgi:prolyl-tRNA editing enzyme YbaK/EbsC (Cys-tRNA(Pro) deacylase)